MPIKQRFDFELFQKSLQVAIEYHMSNQNDPHGISTAVMAALIEVETALAKSIVEVADD